MKILGIFAILFLMTASVSWAEEKPGPFSIAAEYPAPQIPGDC